MAVTDRGLTYEADPRHSDRLMSLMDLTEANSSGTLGVKPTDRDDRADKTDEPLNTKLHDADFSDPNAVIAAILSDANGPARCAKRQQPYLPNCGQSQSDSWQNDVEQHGTFTRMHGVLRKALTHQTDIMRNVEHLQPMRLICGTSSDGEEMSMFDSWKTKTRHELK